MVFRRGILSLEEGGVIRGWGGKWRENSLNSEKEMGTLEIKLSIEIQRII